MSALSEVAETVEALAAKVRSCVMENQPEAARTYTEALRDACGGLRDLVEADEEEDDDGEE